MAEKTEHWTSARLGVMKLPGKRGCSIRELPEPYRTQALALWHSFCERRRRERGLVERWYFGMAAGIAKRLVLNPFTSARGRSMLAKRGGYATQARFRAEGRNMGAEMTRCRVAQRAAIRRARQPGFARVGHSGLRGI